MRAKLTARTIDDLKSRERGYVVSDQETPAFQVRVYRSGSRSLYVVYRSPLTRRKVRYRLARWPKAKGETAAKNELVRQARADAFEALVQVGRGIDPQHERRVEREQAKAELEARRAVKAERERRKTFGEVAEEMLEDPHVAALKSSNRIESQLRFHWQKSDAEVWDRPIEDLRLSDFRPRIEAFLRAGKIGLATQARKHAGMVLTFAVQMDYLAGNRLSSYRMRRPKNLPQRSRALSLNELGALWVASKEVKEPWATAFRLLILTACRKTEVLSIAWDLIGDDEGAHFYIPKEIEKMERGRRVELSEAAAKQLAAFPRLDGSRFVFENRTGDGWIKGHDKTKRAWIDRAIEIGEEHGVEVSTFRLHDLRHSFKTWATETRIDDDVSEAVLGHKKPGIAGRYDHARLVGPQREALEAYADAILANAARFEG